MNQLIIYLMVFFMFVGALDRCLGNKYGYGEKFEDGINAAGPLMLSMIGILSLIPFISRAVKPAVTLFSTITGADPSVLVNILLAVDMGGYALALELAATKESALFSGLLLGSMLGTTLTFTIPVALSIIEKKDHEVFSKGILSGIATIPLGCIAGGIAAGFPLKMVLINTMPVAIFSLLISIGLWLQPEKMSRGFIMLGKFLMVLITGGLAFTILETLTGVSPLKGLAELGKSMLIVAKISMVLAGALPLIHFITKNLKKYLTFTGSLIGISDIATAGLLASLASNIGMFRILKEMERDGKIINVTFAVSGAFTLGGQLAYIAASDKTMIFPFILGKLVAGISGIILAKKLFCDRESISETTYV